MARTYKRRKAERRAEAKGITIPRRGWFLDVDGHVRRKRWQPMARRGPKPITFTG